MTTLPPLKAGIYRHYKGHLYQVLGYAHDANADSLQLFPPVIPEGEEWTPLQPLGERMVVVYFGLQLDEAHTGPRLAVRTVDDFLAYVDPANGSRVPEAVVEASQGSVRYVEGCGYVPRFQYEGSQFKTHMIAPEPEEV